MFKVVRKGSDRLDIELSGKLNADDMRIALDELVEKSQGIENGKMLYDVVEFHIPSLEAMAIEFSRLPAMLSDKTWLKKISELEGALFPGLEIKAFNRDQKEEAETWLSE